MKEPQTFFHSLLTYAETGLSVLATWTNARGLTPEDLPDQLRQRFFAQDGTIAIYAFPAQSVYDPDHLDQLVKEVYSVSKNATGPPITHQWFSQVVLKRLRLSAVLGIVLAGIWIVVDLEKHSRVPYRLFSFVDRRRVDDGHYLSRKY